MDELIWAAAGVAGALTLGGIFLLFRSPKGGKPVGERSIPENFAAWILAATAAGAMAPLVGITLGCLEAGRSGKYILRELKPGVCCGALAGFVISCIVQLIVLAFKRMGKTGGGSR